MQWRRVRGAEARRLDAEPTEAPTAVAPEQPARSRNPSRPSDIHFACAGTRSARLRRLLRLSHIGFAAIRRHLTQAIDHMEGLICQSGSRSRQTELSILRIEGTQGSQPRRCARGRPPGQKLGEKATSPRERVEALGRAVPGSPRAPPGDPVGALQAHRTVAMEFVSRGCGSCVGDCRRLPNGRELKSRT